ncbi:MAG TPA: flagellar hook-associated protein FlgK [Solirubrobacteraceae bacterium]|jgi:flagellar hook-associated protein 1 FlgK|nr:flagellar hook-associated protein FlgK [Solirubrobacteraceae bacterium]
MSIPTLQGLQTALSGLLAEQQAIDTTGHNITNANTEGYSRQVAVLQTNDPMRIAALSPTNGEGAQLGTGVSVATITRIRNTYLDAQYRTQNAGLGAATTQANELQQAQSAFDEPSSAGLSSQLSAFWSAWSELADTPSSEAAKVSVVTAGTQVADTLHEVNAQLQTIQAQAAEQYNAITGPSGEVHADATQIAQLNQQIKLSLQAKQQPNDLEDRRDLLLDKLSELGNVTVTKEANGTDTVAFGNAAQPLVEGSTVTWPQALTSAAGGKLGALLELASPEGALAKYQGALNEVAKTLASTVNALHTATPFFSGATAATIAVAVKASQVQTAGPGNPEGNEVALAIAGLRGGGAEAQYAALIAQVGSDVQSAKSDATNAQAVVTAVGGQRQSVSGVSLDEEMTNLITFQRGYQSSARALTSMDEMLDTLINHTGVTGL